MAKPKDGNQKGAQNHAEGQHGDKAHSEFIKNLHVKQDDTEDSENEPSGQNDADAYGRPILGRHRLHEDRQQHDEADKNSEANRLRR